MATVSLDRSWLSAYQAFLRDKDESFILKIAPLILLMGAPEILVSNLLPGIGEVLDLGSVSVATIVALRTLMAVRKHR